MTIFAFFPFLVLLCTFFLTVFVYFKNPNNELNRTCAFYGLSITIWLVGVVLIYSAKDKNVALYAGRVAYSGVTLIPIAGHHFVCAFLKLTRDLKNKIIILITYIIGFSFLYLCNYTNLFLTDVWKYFWGYYPRATIFQTFSFIFFVFLFNRLLILLMMNLKREKYNLSPFKLMQTKLIFLAMVISTLSGFDFLPTYGINFYAFGYITTLLFFLIIIYAIVKYRLLDVKLIITRTGIFIAIYSLILGIPFFIGYNLRDFLISQFGNNWWLGPLVTSTILATLGPFIYLYFEKKAEGALLKEQKSYQNILRNASSGMIRIKDLSRLLNLIVHVVTKTVRIKNAAIYLLDKENNSYVLQALRGDGYSKQVQQVVDAGSPLIWTMTHRKSFIVAEEERMRLSDESSSLSLSKLNDQLLNLKAALVVPSFVDENLIGFIVLGEKVSKKLYSEDDMNVFSVLANQAALAIENAQFYNEIKQTHEQLFQAEKLATIGTMADGLSHQINNRFHALSLISGDALDVLNTFDSSSCNAETKQMMAEIKTSLEKIQNNVLQGGEVVKGLLKYSRPGESGFEQVDFKNVLKGALDMVQYKIKLGEIDIVEKIPADLPKIFGNQNQLQEVFFNLIDNAYDSIKEKQTMLNEEKYRGRIEVIANVGDNAHIEICVIDNGMGIKEVDRKKMFTPFFTTKASSKKGTGLGLYVIKKIISAHNGTITIDSEYEKVTTFLIKLPLNHEATTKIN